MGVPTPLTPQDLFEQASIRQANSISSDASYVLGICSIELREKVQGSSV